MHNPLYLLFLLQMANGDTSQTTVDLETLDEDALADEFEGGDFLQDTVIGGFVEADSVYCLVLNLSLRPLLLFGGLSTTRCGRYFCFGLIIQIQYRSSRVNKVHPAQEVIQVHQLQLVL